ncbi:hypothetical protein GCK32_013170 [Trichostrongylus colubriformis]|uniref:Uncharacterized protein n=1 Tax=Trichostrongylus colubriformis TaxID=6319 RepID=A0AAN8FGG8_TRICO
MKVVLIVLLFACFLTHAYITTNRKHKSFHQAKAQSRPIRSPLESVDATNNNGNVEQGEMPPMEALSSESEDSKSIVKRESGSAKGPKRTVPGGNLHHNLFMVVDARKNTSALQRLVVDLGKNYRGSKAVIREVALPNIRAYQVNSAYNSADDDDESSSTTKEGVAEEASPDVDETKEKPCSMKHLKYVEKNEKAGCSGAMQFTNEVCQGFYDCMKQPQASYTTCQPGICDQFKQLSSNTSCMAALFACE